MLKIFLLVTFVVAISANSFDQPRVKRSDDISLSNLQAMIDQQASAILSLQSDATVAKNKLLTTETRLAAAESRLQVVEGKQSTTVAFTLRFSTNPVEIGHKGTFKFDQFVTSIGGGYDPHTGLFTAPASGVYVFYLTIMSNNGGYFEAILVKEGSTLDAIHAGSLDSHTMYDQGSLLVTVHLTKGEKVWIEQTSNGSTSLRGGPWTIFSGYLVKAD